MKLQNFSINSNLKYCKIIKDSGFRGYIDIEYEGDKLSEEEGILTNNKKIIGKGSYKFKLEKFYVTK